jgi:hypothetical protein
MNDIDELFRKFAQLDNELKQLRQEVNQLKPIDFYQAKAGPATKPKCWVPQWEEGLEK